MTSWLLALPPSSQVPYELLGLFLLIYTCLAEDDPWKWDRNIHSNLSPTVLQKKKIPIVLHVFGVCEFGSRTNVVTDNLKSMSSDK